MINNHIGIASPYEIPQRPELIIDTSSIPIEDTVQKIFEYLSGYLSEK